MKNSHEPVKYVREGREYLRKDTLGLEIEKDFVCYEHEFIKP